MPRLLLVLLLTACGRIGFDGVTSTGLDGSSADGDNAISIDAAAGTLLPALVADTYLEAQDNSPNGDLTGVLCGRNSGAGHNMWGLWRFDLGAIPAQPISNATLRLFNDAGSRTESMDFEVYALTQAWDEATADWDNAATGVSWTGLGGGAIGSTVYATTSIVLDVPGYYDWNVTTLVNEWLLGTLPNHGLQMQYAVQPSPGASLIYAAKENPNVPKRPQLLITP